MLVRLAPWLFVTMWATGYIGMKLGAPYAEPMTFLSIRFLLVLLILVPVCWLFRVPQLRPRDWLRSMFVGAWLHGIYLGAVLWAISHGMAAGIAALIISLQPIVTSVASPLVLGERVRAMHWCGLLLGAAGVVFVAFPTLDLGGAAMTLETTLAAVISLASITFATLYQKATAADLDVTSALVPQYVGAALTVGLLAYLTETREVEWTWQFIIAQIWLVFVLSIGAVSLFLHLLRENAAWRTSALFYLIPAVTAVFAWLLFGEQLRSMQLIGMALVTLAVFIVRPGSPDAG